MPLDGAAAVRQAAVAAKHGIKPVSIAHENAGYARARRERAKWHNQLAAGAAPGMPTEKRPRRVRGMRDIGEILDNLIKT